MFKKLYSEKKTNGKQAHTRVAIMRAMELKAKAEQAAKLQVGGGPQQQAREKRVRGLVSESADSSKPKKQTLLDQRAEMLAVGGTVQLSKSED